MKQLILALSVFVLFSCNGSSSSSKKSAGDLTAACEATTAAEFFAALAGDMELAAVDTFVENGDTATTDDTFVDGEVYTVTFAANKTLTIPTENGDDVFTFGDEKEDMFGAYDHEVNVRMDRDNAVVLVQLPCGKDAGEPLFIAYSDPAGWESPFVSAFYWRLDAGAL